MGAARGIDEGLISGTTPRATVNRYLVILTLYQGTFNSKNFQDLLHFDELDETAYANVKGNVSAMVQIGSVGGALM